VSAKVIVSQWRAFADELRARSEYRAGGPVDANGNAVGENQTGGQGAATPDQVKRFIMESEVDRCCVAGDLLLGAKHGGGGRIGGSFDRRISGAAVQVREELRINGAGARATQGIIREIIFSISDCCESRGGDCLVVLAIIVRRRADAREQRVCEV